MPGQPAFTFIDLFAGIGGFHAALSALGGKCVYASEIDEKAAAVYAANWDLEPDGDITKAANDQQVTVPEHDVLAAGFPCQPFSKSGYQLGMDEARGTLFWNIAKIIEARRPALVLLENVRNIAGPRHAHEWAVIIKTLRQQGYRVADDAAVFSPHLLPPERGGRPQVRDRVFIAATRVRDLAPGEVVPDDELDDDDLRAEPPVSRTPVDGWQKDDWQLTKHLPLDPKRSTKDLSATLSKAERRWIDAWDDFVTTMWEVRDGKRLPGFPLWADHWVLPESLDLPEDTPAWKRSHLENNARFYAAHQGPIERWLTRWERLEGFPPSRRKLEWQAQDTPRLWDTVMHFRPSGIRAKQPTYLPALVAITQTSILGGQERRITVQEATRLQGLPEGFKFGTQPQAATFKQLGNGVNVGVVYHVMRELVERDAEVLRASAPALYRAVSNSDLNPDPLVETLLPTDKLLVRSRDGHAWQAVSEAS